MHRHLRFRFLASMLFVLMLTFVPALALAQTPEPAASPALDASQVAGKWVARANDQRNGQVDGSPLAGAPTILWAADRGTPAYLPAAVGDDILVVQSETALAVVDRMTGGVLWETPIESSSSAPSLVDGVIYTGSLQGAMAIDARNGEKIWTFAPVHELESTPPEGFPPESMVDAPVAVIDRTVYVSGGVYGGLWALDATTGQERWFYDTDGGMPAVVSYQDGTLYLTADGLGDAGMLAGSTVSRLQAVDAASGQLVWSVELPAESASYSTPTVLGDTLLIGISSAAPYVGSWNAYDRLTGTLLWSTPYPLPPWPANAAGKDGLFFVAGAEVGGVLALDAVTGDVVWQHETAHMDWWGMIVAGNVLYVRTEEPAIEALDTATGALLWSLPAGEPDQPTSGITYGDGVLYSGAGTEMFAISGDGGPAPDPGESALSAVQSLGPEAGDFLQWGGVLSTPEEFQGPEGIAIRPNGEIFVVDSRNDRIQIFSPNGEFDRIWPADGDASINFSFHEPDGFFFGDLAFAADGSLYVTDPLDGQIQMFDADLNPTGEFLLPSIDPDDPSRPAGIALDEDAGRLYVADFAHSNLFVFDLDGNHLATWGPNADDVDVPLLSPNDVTVGPDGNIYVTDTLRSRIRILTPEGEHIGVWGGIGGGPGQFAGAVAIAFDPDGNAYISDYVGDRIQVISPNGTTIGQFGSPGSGDGELQQPTFLAFAPDGRLILSDETNNRVVILTTASTAPVASPVASPAA